MNRWVLFLIVSVAAWLQAYFFAALTPWHGLFSIVLPLLLGIVLTRGLMMALVAAVWAGFWVDVASPSPLGVHMLFYVLFVMGAVLLMRSGWEFNRRLTVAMVLALGVLVYHNWLVFTAWLQASSSLWQPTLWQFWLLDIVITLCGAVWFGRWFREHLRIN